IQALATVDERHGVFGEHEGPAHRIARHRHAALRHVTAAAPVGLGNPVDDAIDEAPEGARDDDDEDDEQRDAEHHVPGFLPAAGCADCRLSSARFAACPSGALGAMAITCCHAWIAPSRSCLPNAFTIPRLSSVFACFGSMLSECANCSSALSGWLE